MWEVGEICGYNLPMKSYERIVNADIIRVLAMIMVVLFHTVTVFTVRKDFLFTKLFFLLIPIVVLSRVAVLLFFMLSGYLVLRKSATVISNSRKVLKKIIIPLSFFTLLNIIIDLSFYIRKNSELVIFVNQQWSRMSQRISSPMWFLVVLSFLYILNPFFWKLLNVKNKKIPIITTILFLLFSVFITVFEYFFLQTGNIFSSFNYWIVFIFFYLYGALISSKFIEVDNKLINFSIFTIGFVLSSLGNLFFKYYPENVSLNYFENYLSIPVIMMAIGLFNLIISANFERIKSKLLFELSSLSYGVYLIHTYIIRFFIDYLGFTFDNLKINVYLFNILNLALVFSISLFVTYLLKRIPKLKLIIGG